MRNLFWDFWRAGVRLGKCGRDLESDRAGFAGGAFGRGADGVTAGSYQLSVKPVGLGRYEFGFKERAATLIRWWIRIRRWAGGAGGVTCDDPSGASFSS